METGKYELGLIGLGTMGRNLLLNLADSNYAVAGYDKDTEKLQALKDAAKLYQIYGAGSISDLVLALKRPRALLLLVPAGRIVDAVIGDLRPHLEEGDVIIDGGNSHFLDTARRQNQLSKDGIHFLGLGISGGAEGARHGPSMMPGGPRAAWERVQDMLEATAADVEGEPCVSYLGKGAVGHYVKMVHNGIEYGLMQLLAESYDLMKRGLSMTNDAISSEFSKWNAGELESFLVEITAAIFAQKDTKGHDFVVDNILDKSKQKGTGKWTSQDAMELQVPVPVIDLAVAMRDMSGYKEERVKAAKLLKGPDSRISTDTQSFLKKLRKSVYFSFITTYAQGFALLKAASAEYSFDLNPGEVAKIWRGGCIIRAALLSDIRKAFELNDQLGNIMVDPELAALLMDLQEDVREVAMATVKAGIPAPGLLNALSYFDAYRSAVLPANLIQAQRDFFGSHTYERIDEEGVFHTDWNG